MGPKHNASRTLLGVRVTAPKHSATPTPPGAAAKAPGRIAKFILTIRIADERKKNVVRVLSYRVAPLSFYLAVNLQTEL